MELTRITMLFIFTARYSELYNLYVMVKSLPLRVPDQVSEKSELWALRLPCLGSRKY